MSDFILKRREFDVVPNLLLEAVPNFSQSDEFKALDEEERKMPGLVCAAFAKRLLHLHQALSRAIFLMNTMRVADAYAWEAATREQVCRLP